MPEPGPIWEIGRLGKAHDRGAFESGDPELDEFLRRFARQNEEKGISRTYVAVRTGSVAVVGYYSLRGGAVAFDVMPEEERRRLPRYPVPVVHLARLAVDQRARGQRLGESLLMHALDKALRISDELGMHAVEVQAKNDGARAFYKRYGFIALPDDPLHMYLSMKAIRAVFGGQ